MQHFEWETWIRPVIQLGHTNIVLLETHLHLCLVLFFLFVYLHMDTDNKEDKY